jgi:tetratricopeptide (TPR) repeat protein
MGRHFFPAQAKMPADHVREALYEAEALVGGLQSADSGATKLLYLIDEIGEALEDLEAAGLDVRPERSRLETLQRKLFRNKRRFLARAGAAFQEARAEVQPDRERWWWFLDEALVEERQKRLRRVLLWGAAAAIVVAVAIALFYILVPRERRLAAGHRADGESAVQEAASLIQEGETLALEGKAEEAEQKFEAAKAELGVALIEFEAAAELVPDNAEDWVWVGVLRSELGRAGAEQAFETARELYGCELDFLLERSQSYQYVGNLDAASADVEQAILDYPESGLGYYQRSFIVLQRGDIGAAVADLEKAAELANEAGDAQLEALARVRLGMLPAVQPTATP